jgi:hypothetical protein
VGPAKGQIAQSVRCETRQAVQRPAKNSILLPARKKKVHQAHFRRWRNQKPNLKFLQQQSTIILPLHPINPQKRELIYDKVLLEYKEVVRSNQTRILQESSNSNQRLRTEIDALAKMSSSLFNIYMSIKKNIMKTTGSLAGYNLLSNGEIDQYLDSSFFNPYTIDRIDSEFTYHIELMIKLTKEAHNNH